jgi:hypothetical protein
MLTVTTEIIVVIITRGRLRNGTRDMLTVPAVDLISTVTPHVSLLLPRVDTARSPTSVGSMGTNPVDDILTVDAVLGMDSSAHQYRGGIKYIAAAMIFHVAAVSYGSVDCGGRKFQRPYRRA